MELQRVYEDLLKVVESSKEIETEQLTKDILQAATVPTTPTEEVDDPCTPSSDDEIASLPDKTSIIQPVSSTIPSQTIPFCTFRKNQRRLGIQ